MAAFSFNAVEHQDTDISAPTAKKYLPIPEGDYQAVITDSDVRTTKAGDGRYIALTFEIISSNQYEGRRIWMNYNVENPSAKAVETGNRLLADICRATNVPNFDDTELLHMKPMIVSVIIEPASGGYDEKNQIRAYKSASVEVATTETAAPVAAEPAAKKPWDL